MSYVLKTSFLLPQLFCNVESELYTFFISNTFISNTSLKFAKCQAKIKQQPEAELLLFENYTLSSFMLLSKTNMSKMCKKQVPLI